MKRGIGEMSLELKMQLVVDKTMREMIEKQRDLIREMWYVLLKVEWAVDSEEESCPYCYHHKSEGHQDICILSESIGKAEKMIDG